MADISTKTARSKLAARREPHWMKLSKGLQLGYRAGAGTWIAKYRKSGSTKRLLESLGECEDFSEAKARAEAWASASAGSAHRIAKRGTVRSAMAAYVWHLWRSGRKSTAWETLNRFQLVLPKGSPLADMRMEDVHDDAVRRWRDGMRKGRGVKRKRKGRASGKSIAVRSVQRQFRAVRAAARWALTEGSFTGNREAWTITALDDDEEQGTAVFLTARQRERLIAHSPATLALLLLAWDYTGSRPSEMANAKVKDFDGAAGTLLLRHRKGRTSALKVRAVVLDKFVVKFFQKQTQGKAPEDPVIPAPNGKHWSKFDWPAQIRAAADAANKTAKTPEDRIPAKVSAYSMRHSRISEWLQLGKLDPLSVAHQCGTSTAMIERHYFKFLGDNLRKKLDELRDAAKPKEMAERG